MNDIFLPALPRLGPRYLRAAATARHRRQRVLGDRRLVVDDVLVDVGRLAGWARCVGEDLRDDVPAAYPAVLALPLAIALMVDHPFPFALPGLVHVRQHIQANRPLRVGEAVTLRVGAQHLAAEARGATVDVVAQVLTAGEVVWTGTSTYLSRQKLPEGTALPPPSPVAELGDVADLAELAPSALWRVSSQTGRRFAAITGDVNPIHLSALSARAFGFPRAIAHGQWTLARVLATLPAPRPGSVSVDAAFRRPLLLPSTVEVVSRVGGAGRGDWDLAVRPAGVREERSVHLVASVRAGR